MLLIKNATVYTMENDVLENTDILVENSLIKEVGQNIQASADEIIDASGMVVLPGFVDAHSHIGGFTANMVDQDVNEMTKNITPEVESIYAIDYSSEYFDYALKHGTTCSAIAPGSGNVIGGYVCAVKSYGKSMEDMVIKNPVALKMALGGNPKGVYGKKGKSPMTRMAIAQIIREYLNSVKDYMKKKEEAQGDMSKMPPYDQGLENGIPVIKKELPIKMHCTMMDMMTIIRIAKEFDVNFTIDHAWGASDYYDEISESGVTGVIFGPIGVSKFPGECGKIDIYSLIELDKRGVPCAIMTDGPILKAEMMMVQAGEVVRYGGDVERVLRMLTINPAEMLGIDDRVGSIKPGKDADIVIFKGTPALDTRASVKYTIINGEVVYKA
ncbi:amidohydrolase family protein [Clostridium polynesiense]|uniref:amidohydrolase family protein n=1 Tax=Clostridium polynesiense TaxID=1325933 RepID=UPI00058E257C|nr:amidohydrolase family protein [Clostridium polynesiense]